MKNRIFLRLAFILIAFASLIVIVETISIVSATHHHFTLIWDPDRVHEHEIREVNAHLEQVVLQSIIWTCVGSIALACLIGFYAARKISRPLLDMKQVARQMTEGQWDVRVHVKGSDELSQLGQSINELAAQLQKQESLRVSMTEDIAHELRTPLTTLKSHMRALEDRIWEPTPERIHSCYEEIERLISLVQEVEDLMHMESPGFTLSKESKLLLSIIMKSAQIVEVSLKEKGIQFEYQVDPELEIVVDYHRFIQIFVNLLTNAVKHTPSCGKIRVEATESPERIVITVYNSGEGIAEEDLPYIFDRFFRGDKSRNRKTGGSGLGLTIVEKLVKAHGGAIQAQNKEGAVFTLEFPNIKPL